VAFFLVLTIGDQMEIEFVYNEELLLLCKEFIDINLMGLFVVLVAS